MAKCETCGNDCKKTFQVVMDGKTHTFDCFECAIQLLAPACVHCGCAIIGHGVEREGQLFCCEHCARHLASLPIDVSGDGHYRIIATQTGSRTLRERFKYGFVFDTRDHRFARIYGASYGGTQRKRRGIVPATVHGSQLRAKCFPDQPRKI